MPTHVVLRALFFIFCVVFLFTFAGAARADNIVVTAAITSFTGNVLGQNETFYEYCPANSCGVIGPPPPTPVICPDIGCSAVQGIGHATFGGDPTHDTVNQLSFFVDSGTPNGLTFQTAHDPGSFALNDVDPTNAFKLGTLTFTNGVWTGDADFGFSIVAHDSTTGATHTFDGLIHMALTPNSTTNSPAANADFIFLTDPNGNPIVNPLTLVPLPSIRAYELADSPTGSNTVSVDIFGKFGSLDLTSYENVQGGGFLDTSLTTDLGGPPSSSVPEPASFALLGCGALLMAALRKKLL